jgi:HPt (histidine-containing phosphotransfer) domain-containing protein
METGFDFLKITEAMEMDAEDIRHLMDLYQPELTRDIASLEEDLVLHAWAQAAGKLHKMKGDAANLCLPALADLLTQMETAANNRDAQAAAAQLSELKDMKHRFDAAYFNYVNGMT